LRVSRRRGNFPRRAHVPAVPTAHAPPRPTWQNCRWSGSMAVEAAGAEAIEAEEAMKTCYRFARVRAWQHVRVVACCTHALLPLLPRACLNACRDLGYHRGTRLTIGPLSGACQSAPLLPRACLDPCRDLGYHRRHPTYHRAARRSMSGSQPRSRQPSRALTCCNPFSNPCSPLLQIFNAPTTAAVAAVVPTVTAVATTTAADAHAVGGPIPYGILSTAPRFGIDPPHLAPAVAPTTTPTTTLPYHRPGRLRPKQLPRPPR
jgi:hypothetical protein